MNELPPIELLRELLEYNPETGELRWKNKSNVKSSRSKIGELAGSPQKNGYSKIQINNRQYLNHRICWALYYGEDPYPFIVDHIEGVEKGDGIANLRLATDSENIINAKKNKRNTSGFRGVYFKRATKRWFVQCRFNGSTKTLGTYDCKEDAITARLNFERENNIWVRED